MPACILQRRTNRWVKSDQWSGKIYICAENRDIYSMNNDPREQHIGYLDRNTIVSNWLTTVHASCDPERELGRDCAGAILIPQGQEVAGRHNGRLTTAWSDDQCAVINSKLGCLICYFSNILMCRFAPIYSTMAIISGLYFTRPTLVPITYHPKWM